MNEFTARQMLRTLQFYVIFVTFLFSAGALMCIGLMKLFPISALTAKRREATIACGPLRRLTAKVGVVRVRFRGAGREPQAGSGGFSRAFP